MKIFYEKKKKKKKMASLCFFCKDAYRIEYLIPICLDGMDVISKCEHCEKSLFANIISFKDRKKRKSSLQFYAKNDEEEIKFENFKELEDNKNNFKYHFFGFKFTREGEKKPKKVFYYKELDILAEEIQLKFDVESTDIVLQIDYLKKILKQIHREYSEHKQKKKQAQQYVVQNFEWTTRLNQFFPNKLNCKIFVLFLCLKRIRLFTSDWKTPIKIPKFIVHYIITFL